MKRKTFGDLRKMSKMSATQTAKKLGISESAYRKYECSNRLPPIPIVIKMLQTYQCSAEDLLEACEFHNTVRKFRKDN
ncbi:helix-turn-helix domain-containing protein [Inconstantimicrobium mannanitabidum]|uniref:Uncharacterized protein n=1 Tax=Inconstantimicrobium mannanitabidum TaxID=1604901 RepID=A0ACB5R924_9CLOT|nr:helix-turn-helix transcriptional regulator [Clostridium sp. TW13]GKX65605.1 hypothetical protein rsdtw13_08630 [Clostridium sp. TW13]